MKTIEIILNIAISVTIISMIIITASAISQTIYTSKACDNAGGLLNNEGLFLPDNCIINQEPYGIYRKDNSFFPEYELSKYPIGVRNGK